MIQFADCDPILPTCDRKISDDKATEKKPKRKSDGEREKEKERKRKRMALEDQQFIENTADVKARPCFGLGRGRVCRDTAFVYFNSHPERVTVSV